MPKDQEEESSEQSVHLTESPNRLESPMKKEPDESEPTDTSNYQKGPGAFTIVPKAQQYSGPTNLHPYTRPLTISDLESCVALENAAFSNPIERATREKVSFATWSRDLTLRQLSAQTRFANNIIVHLQTHQVQ